MTEPKRRGRPPGKPFGEEPKQPEPQKGLLSDREIKEQLSSGNIVIEPFDERQLGANSYDCRLGKYYFHPQFFYKAIMDVSLPETVREYWGLSEEATKYIVINPNETILTHTQEVIGGKNGYTGMMKARSSIIRMGLSVAKAGVGDVGYIDHWTVELTNHTNYRIQLPVGIRFCQILFEYVGPTDQEYKGSYSTKTWEPDSMLPKIHKDWDIAEILEGKYR